MNFENKKIIKESEFAFRDDIEIINFSSKVTKIGKKAFEGCKNLKEIFFNDGLLSIGQEAFIHCDDLIKISLPKSLVSIGGNCFSQCPKLKIIEFRGSKSEFIAKRTKDFNNLVKKINISYMNMGNSITIDNVIFEYLPDTIAKGMLTFLDKSITFDEFVSNSHIDAQVFYEKDSINFCNILKEEYDSYECNVFKSIESAAKTDSITLFYRKFAGLKKSKVIKEKDRFLVYYFSIYYEIAKCLCIVDCANIKYENLINFEKMYSEKRKQYYFIDVNGTLKLVINFSSVYYTEFEKLKDDLHVLISD